MFSTGIKRIRDYGKEGMGAYGKIRRFRAGSSWPRSRRKKRIYQRRRATIQRSIQSSESNIVTLKYVDQKTLDPGINVLSNHVFRANSVFKPDFTDAGHQPLGFDQWSALYTNYIVRNAWMKVTVVTGTTPSTNTIVFGVDIKTTSSPAATTLITQLEQARTYGRVVGNDTNATSNRSIVRKFDARRLFGFSSYRDSVPAYGAEVTDNPSEEAYFIIWITNYFIGADVTSQTLLVEINYDVLFTERKSLATS